MTASPMLLRVLGSPLVTSAHVDLACVRCAADPDDRSPVIGAASSGAAMRLVQASSFPAFGPPEAELAPSDQPPLISW